MHLNVGYSNIDKGTMLGRTQIVLYFDRLLLFYIRMTHRRFIGAAGRGESEVRRVAKINKCTEEGTVWMLNALDPFPDTKREIVGFPDAVKTPSVAQYFREEITVTKPDTVTDGNWDCLIWHPGYENQCELTTGGHDNNILFESQSQTVIGTTSMCEIRAGPAGDPLYLTTLQGSTLPIVDFALPHRMCAMGIECFNTTAELHKQGAVTVFKQPPIAGEQISVLTDAGNQRTGCNTVIYNDAPATPTQALILEGSKQWAAAKGSYCVATLSDSTNPPRSAAAPEFMYISGQDGETYFPQLTNSASTVYPQIDVKRSGYDQFGSMFTGLSPETSITVVVHYIIERFPGWGQTDLVTMAKPSIAFDPEALELYTRIVSRLDAGVPVGDNAAGFWIGALGSVASSLLPHVVTAGKTAWNNRNDGKSTTDKVLDVLKAINPMGWVGDLPKITPELLGNRRSNLGKRGIMPSVQGNTQLVLRNSPAIKKEITKQVAKQVNTRTQKQTKSKVGNTRQGRFISNNVDLRR